MSNQKLEPMLNASMEIGTSQRESSPLLSSAVNSDTNLWDIIVRYNGDLEEILSGIIYSAAVPLLGGYGIITLPENQINALSRHPLIQYVEQPKPLYFQVAQGKSASCISAAARPPYNLTGQGVLIGIADSGLALSHPDFRTEDGSTRVLRFWDQTRQGTPPAGYTMGTEFTQEDINAGLSQGGLGITDSGGHGTAVAGIAAGNGRQSSGRYAGVAPQASLLIVRLAPSRPNSFPRTSELMQAVNYLVTQAIALQMPLALNISIGNTYGPHDGTSLLETFLDNICGLWKVTLCVGMGNEGNDAGHTQVILSSNSRQSVSLGIGAYETSLSVQLWKAYTDSMTLTIESPSGQLSPAFSPLLEPLQFVLDGTRIMVYYGEPNPYSISQEIFLLFSPGFSSSYYITEGIWIFHLNSARVVHGNVDLWLPDSGQRNVNTRFYTPIPDTTLTIPSAASKVISVGAYDSTYMTYADFSGRGFTRRIREVKPDLAAPGVNIMSPDSMNGYSTVTGTSFACPFVTGSAALLMEWGIVRGNDPFLFGEKAKALLRSGARPLEAETVYPNPRIGYGVLCLEQTLRMQS